MHILVALVFSKNRFLYGKLAHIFGTPQKHNKQNFHLKKISDLLDRHFYVCAHFWNYSTITGAAGAVQKSPKFAFLYGKLVGKCWGWESARDFR